MWIFLNDAFVSVVAVPGKPGKLLVRARRPGDVQRALGDPKLIEVETPKADYRYRAEVDWAVVQEALTQRLEALDYPNFKNSVKDHARHEAYSSVWWSMYDYQHGRFDRPKTTTG